MILICLLVGILLTFGYICLVAVCPKTMVWISYIVFFIGVFVFGVALFMRYTDLKSGVDKEYNWESPTLFLVLAIVAWSIGLLAI